MDTKLDCMQTVEVKGKNVDYTVTNVGPVNGGEGFLFVSENTTFLLDDGFSFCGNALVDNIKKVLGDRGLDYILLTHSHYDHVGGMDDLRPFCQFGDINVYSDSISEKSLRSMMPYCFVEHPYPGVPKISLHDIHPHQELKINELTVIPLQVMHDKLPILGYKIGRLAYITDMKTIPEGEIDYLQDIDYLVVNALRFTKPHHSHMLVDEALEFARKTSAKQVFLTHMCHDIGLFDEAEQKLPEGIHLSYDREVVEI